MKSTSGRGASESHGKTMRSPRSPQSSTVASSSSRSTRDRPGARLDATDRGQQERRQLRVAQRVGAHREARLVVEQAERSLLPRAQEVLLVGHAPQADDEMGEAPIDVGDDVEQAGAAGAQDLGAHDHRGALPARPGAAPATPR